jgi:hypothetical protein
MERIEVCVRGPVVCSFCGYEHRRMPRDPFCPACDADLRIWGIPMTANAKPQQQSKATPEAK